MDKREEILEKSRRENAGRDEMERAVAVEGESFSLVLTLLVGLVLVVYNHIRGLSSDCVMIMFWTSCAAGRLYRLTRRKSASDLATLLLSLALLLFYMVKYFTGR